MEEDLNPVTERSFIKFQLEYPNLCKAIEAWITDRSINNDVNALNHLNALITRLMQDACSVIQSQNTDKLKTYGKTSFDPKEFN